MSIFRKLTMSFAVVGAFVLPATSATAASCLDDVQNMVKPHEVRILSNGYFPRTLYVQQGDKIRFMNMTSYSARVSVYNQSGNLTSWITSTSNNNCETITMNSSSSLTLNKPSLYNASNDNGKQGFLKIGIAPSQ